MATRFSVGHGMRRRNGTQSHPLEAVGNMKNRSHMTHHEAVDAAASVGSPRLPISAIPALQGTLIPKKNTQAADPSNPGSKANRQNIEKIGATYRVSPKSTFVQLDPSAGPTMASAKLVPSVASVNGSFQDAEGNSYL